jgi:hypothetical protein
MSRCFQRKESRKEFSINRRRNLKSNKSSNAKDIFTKYAKRFTQDSDFNSISKTNHAAKKFEYDHRSSLIQSKRAMKKTKLSNEVTMYDNEEMSEKFLAIIFEFNVWEEHDISVIIFSANHMSINLKSDWANRIKLNRIYSLDLDKCAIMNETFDNLHNKDKIKWFTNSTSFDYFVFVIYRTIMKDDKFVRKERVVINIRELNAIIVSNVYFMSAQTDIIAVVAECQYISVVNVLRYFYQWAIKFDDRHKLTVISHRDQKQFNVCVMSYKNLSSYVQRQTNLMLKNLRAFVRAYMNDIVIFFKILDDHLVHLRKIFQQLWHYNVALNSKKVFLKYSFIILLRQIIDALDLTIAEEKLVAIVNLTFSLTLKKLKVYLNLIDYLRVYVSWYAQVFLSLQERKILLLKDDLVKNKSRRTFAKRILLKQFIEAKQRIYEHLQHVFSDKKFLHHVSNARKLFVDVSIF